jgi:hypothetical protein
MKMHIISLLTAGLVPVSPRLTAWGGLCSFTQNWYKLFPEAITPIAVLGGRGWLVGWVNQEINNRALSACSCTLSFNQSLIDFANLMAIVGSFVKVS